MKKEFLILIILFVVILVLAGMLIFLKPGNKKVTETPANPQQIEGIQVLSPKEGSTTTSPIKITGITNGGGWNGFEGQVGTVKLLDYKGNEIVTGILKATTDWMKPPVSFETNLEFKTDYKGPATLLFSNENPSGDPAKDKKFGWLITIQ